MKKLGAFISVSLLLQNVTAQAVSSPDQEKLLQPIHPSTPLVVGVLSLMFSLTFLVLAYAKFCYRNPPIISVSDVQNGELTRSRSRFSGIDQKVIDSLPFFRFSSLRGSKEGLECAVCINRFEDSEVLRLLPQCKHAFHMDCIDRWLENHSSCPLCRCKFDPSDLTSFAYSTNLRSMSQHIPSNLTEAANLDLLLRREEDNRRGSSRFIDRSDLQDLGKGETCRQELWIEESKHYGSDHQKLLHKFKHKIIITDVLDRSRWSDVNSSDLQLLNSELLSVLSCRRFTNLDSRTRRLGGDFIANDEQLAKIKEDIERKRLFESKVGKMKVSRGNSFLSSSSNVVANPSENPSRLNQDPVDEKRSMSEIVNISRSPFSMKDRTKEPAPVGNSRAKEDRMRRLWLPIVRRTVQWVAGQEQIQQQPEEKVHRLNV